MKRILILQMGGMGDLVLTSALVSALKTAGSHVTVACRAGLEAVAGLFPVAADDVIPLDFHPYVWAMPSPELFAALRPALDRLRQARPDCLVSAALQPTWFAWAAAAAVEADAVGCPGDGPPLGLLPLVLGELGLAPRPIAGPALAPGKHENQRYADLARHLGAGPGKPPPWRPTAADAPGKYLVCFPVGTANVAIKRWPAERFAAVLNAIQQEFALPVVLAGSQAESGELAALAGRIQGPATVFAGRPDQIPALAALTARATAWLGNDSGPAHLAQAYGRPGVCVFGGGGHWRAYAPWGRGTIGVAHPLPCFDCEWDCLFGHPVCLESIPVEPVVESLRRVLRDPDLAPHWVTLERLNPEVVGLIADAAARYRATEKDRADRLAKILELKHAAEVRLAMYFQAKAEADRLR